MVSKDDEHETTSNADELVAEETVDTDKTTSLVKSPKEGPKPDEPVAESAKDPVGSDSSASVAPATARTAPLWAVAALGGVLIALLIALIVNWFLPEKGVPVLNGKAGRVLADQQKEDDSARDAGCDIATKLLSYDHTKVDEFFDNVRAVTTGAFGRGFADDSAALRDLFIRGEVTSRPENVECSLAMIGEEGARVRVKATQHSSSVETQGQDQVEDVELYVELENVDGRWLASDLNPIVSGTDGATSVPGGEQTLPTDGQTAPGETPAPGPEETPVPEQPTP